MRYQLFLWVFLSFTIGLSAGCRKRTNRTEGGVRVPAAEVAASVGVQPQDLPSQQALYDAITKYMSTHNGRAARDVEELVQTGLLKPLPKLPANKRYELDQRAAVLGIVDK
jgi:hypothetical protein